MTAQDVVGLLRYVTSDLHDSIIDESNRNSIQAAPVILKQVSEHASHNELIEAVVRDDSLKKFFPILRELDAGRLEVDFIRRLQSIVMWSDGTSEGMTPLSLCCAIIAGIFQELWSWTDDPSLEEVLNQVPKTVDVARSLASKRRVKAPAVVAIHNVKLPHDRGVLIGSAVLRKPIRFDRSHLLGVSLGPDMDATLRVSVDFKLIHVRSIDQSHDNEREHQKTLKIIESRGFKTMEQQNRQLRDSVDLARLAIVLASPKGKLLAPFQSWSSVVNPLTFMPASGSMSGLQSLKAPHTAQSISPSIERRLDGLAKLLDRNASALRVGGRRLLLAVTERMYPEDGLADAIICWESLFSGTPETSLRVCGSMAKLIGPSNVTKRHELYEELRDLYLARNRAVHGTGNKPEPVTAARDAAIQYALDAFRAILRRSDLLDVPDSARRGLIALLGR
jgi:hypothetical protein